jgi:hypothetical protein
VFSEGHESIKHRKAQAEMGGTAVFFFLLSLWIQIATATYRGFTRSDFPHDFVFGAGTSAYQVSNLLSPAQKEVGGLSKDTMIQ